MGMTLAELMVKVGVDLENRGIAKAARKIDGDFNGMADSAEDAGDRIEKASHKAERAFSDIDIDSPFDELGDDADRFGDRMGDAGDEGGRSFVGRFLGWLRRSLGEWQALAKVLGAGFAARFIAAAAPGIVAGVKHLLAGIGAVAALAPAGILAAALAFGTLKVALSGVGDAISAGLSGDAEKFAEALEGLSPAARNVVRDVVSLKGRLDDLKSSVQQSFFKPLTESVRPLGIYLDQARIVMSRIAGTAGEALAGIARWLVVPAIARQIFGALTNVQLAVQNVIRGFGGLAAAFLPLVVVGSQFLPFLTNGFGSATLRLAEFMQEAQRTGELHAFIERGIDAIRSMIDTGRQLWRIARDIGAIFATVFGSIHTGGEGVLDTLERLVSGARDWVESARGAETLGTIFETLGGVWELLHVQGRALMGVLGRLFGPILPQVNDFVQALVNLADAVLNVGLDALEPVLGAIGAVIGGVVLPALTGLANWLADNKPVLQGIGIAILTLMVPALYQWAVAAGIAAINTLLLWAPIILVGAAIAALAALFIIHWDTIKNVVMAVFNWIKDNWPLLLGILTGPIGWAVLLIVNHWDTIKNAVMAVFNWVRDNWPLLLAIITGPIGMAVYMIVRHWDTIKRGFTAVKDWIRDRVSDIVSFITGIPGRISDAAHRFGSIIKDAITAAKDWVGEKVEQIIDFITSIPDRIGDIGGAIMDRITGGLGGVVSSVGSILGFDTGGVVPGPKGAPRVALVHGGETIVPTHNPSAMSKLDNVGLRDIPTPRGVSMVSPIGGPAAGDVHLHVQGSILAERDIVKLIRDERIRGGFGEGFA